MSEPRETGAAPPSATPHAEPFHCPYCGMEDLVPGEEHGSWSCESCARLFSLRLISAGRS